MSQDRTRATTRVVPLRFMIVGAHGEAVAGVPGEGEAAGATVVP